MEITVKKLQDILAKKNMIIDIKPLKFGGFQYILSKPCALIPNTHHIDVCTGNIQNIIRRILTTLN